uniref:Phosphatidylinositol-specific phospholipase C, X domain containing 1 n=1 Tax=Oncorhynchus tshawytscha TaxID=74940 RepID=A0AAZ3RSK2_ONCTS
MSSEVVSEVQVSLKELPMDSWMDHLPCALWDVPLRNLAIPGHNAPNICLDRRTVGFLTTDQGLKEQLDCGVRYLDLRIAHRPNDTSTDLYFYHGVYTTLTVETVLQEIRSWLDVHSREVVLLSFSHFLGLNQDLHTGLISTIRTIFNARLCPTTEVVTLRNLWSLGYQVIVSYEHSMVSLYSDLWPHIPYWWANKCKAEALIEEFEHRKQHGRPGGFFVTGINLTEDLKYICSHPTESLKDLVMSTYPALLSWVRGQSPGSESHSLNIIAGDFVSESHFVPTVIALNQHLSCVCRE